ncbi:MAG: hypothetical protein BWY47_02140 [Bacteroidetes bacterium ADurb.Bin302]|jgi:hypothetical protein|nr:MAG: hypothetical protein BWY47_02140 [Bacteroidetes bacterium ADurb.Bin302]
MMTDLLSVYRNPSIDIEKELVQLVYYGKVNYSDTYLMSYNARQIWFNEIKSILESQANISNGLDQL